MEHSEISFELVGSSLGEDIFSDQGILLLKKGITLNETHILLLQNYRYGQQVIVEKNDSSSKPKVKSPTKEPYETCLSLVKDTFSQMVQMDDSKVPQLIKEFNHLVDMSMNDVSILALIQTEIQKQDYLYQHSMNVGIFAAIIGKKLGYTKKECMLLATMGLFHDIGMLQVNQSIIEKNEPLLDDEYAEVKKHTQYGPDLLGMVKGLDELVIKAAKSHHERVDGSGYPLGQHDKNPSYFIQIVAVADCFNAMSMKQYGQKKTPFESVYELVSMAQTNKLNPAVVIPFVQYIMRQHLFEEVTLSNGQKAEIIFIHDNEPHQPLLKLENEEYIDLRKEFSLKISY